MSLDDALNKAAADLPLDWLLSVRVEAGAGWVVLTDPEEEERIIDGADRTLAEAVLEAIELAQAQPAGLS